MPDTYEQIWDADQEGNGVVPLGDGQAGDPVRGHVRVRTGPASPGPRVLDDVHIPESKTGSYDLARRLFDNYALAERDPETETPEEREEIHELLTAVVDTPPMQVAREYVQSAAGTTITKERWYATLLEQWFRQFSQAGDPHLTGFEHVFVGEQEGAKVQGYHFWYKYYLDDGFARTYDAARFPGLANDRIEYVRSEAASGQEVFPESVTIAYRWNAPDYDAGQTRPLTKPIGGFFVGCSVEGLMALGTVRAHLGARAPKEAVIKGARYSLKLYRSANNAHVRTFYPVFLGAAPSSGTETQSPVLVADGGIVAATAAAVRGTLCSDYGHAIIPTPHPRLRRRVLDRVPLWGPQSSNSSATSAFRGSREVRRAGSARMRAPESRRVVRVMPRAKKVLATVWLVGAGVVFATMVLQSVLGRYGERTDEAWGWFLPTVMPSLSLILGVLLADVHGWTDKNIGMNPFVLRIAVGLSVAYLLTVALTIFLSPFAAVPVLRLMSQSNTWLGPFQGLVAAALGAFFVSKPAAGGGEHED